MSDTGNIGETTDDPVKCGFCGPSPVLSRAAGAGPNGTGICRDCVVRMTNSMVETMAESTGIVDESLGSAGSTTDEGALWDRFDAAFSRMSLLHGFDRQIENAEESITTSWTGDSADRPATRINGDLAHVRALLSRHGYHEALAVVGIDTALAARGELGSFYAVPDPNDPRWTARIEFRLGETPNVSSA